MFLVVIITSSCNNQIRNDHFFLDMDWKQDIYNIIYTHFDYIEDLEFWVREPPKYINGSPYQKACIEVKLGINKPRFYIANLNLYSLTETKDCSFSNGNVNDVAQVAGENIKEEQYFDNNQWQGKSNVFISYSGDNESGELDEKLFSHEYYTNEKHISLIFSALFPVNQSLLTKEGKEILSEVVKELSSIPVTEITIYGIADSSGDYIKNRQLADRRAASVHQLMINSGLNNIPIKVKGSVENHESTASERVQQRRFIIEVRLAP